MNHLVIVMGVSGSGKSTVAEALARRIGADFLDGDAFHPQANIDKMAAGIPLTDADRALWLATLAAELRTRESLGRSAVLACSALKEGYRRILRISPAVRFIYLQGPFELIQTRMELRSGHFMKSGMLKSQFQALEEPASGPGTDTWTVHVQLPVQDIVDQAMQYFQWEEKQ